MIRGLEFREKLLLLANLGMLVERRAGGIATMELCLNKKLPPVSRRIDTVIASIINPGLICFGGNLARATSKQYRDRAIHDVDGSQSLL